jgi:Ni/Co efflux regulator RcnB
MKINRLCTTAIALTIVAGAAVAQAPDQSQKREESPRAQDVRQPPAAGINDDQRKQIVNQLRSERTATRTSNVKVNIGQRLPSGIQPHKVPVDIVRIVPQYRDYDYTLVDNRIVIVDPRRREVVDILDDGPGAGAFGRIVISDDTRTRFRELARASATTAGTIPSGGASAPNCLSLQPVPEEIARNNPELGNYRYLAIGNQIVLVDPQQKVVQVIE